MHTTKLSVMVVALSVLALGLGLGALPAHAQERWVPALQYGTPLPAETPRFEARRAGSRAESRASLGLGIAGIATGAVGIIGGSVLLIAGTGRNHCSGTWFSDSYSCSALPDDGGLVAGGGASWFLGLVGVITGTVLLASTPRRSVPNLSFGGDSSSVSISIDGTF